MTDAKRPDLDTQVPLRAAKEQKKTWHRAASVTAEGNFSSWARKNLDAAAKRDLEGKEGGDED